MTPASARICFWEGVGVFALAPGAIDEEPAGIVEAKERKLQL